MSEVEIHIVTSSDNMEYRYYVKITRDDIYHAGAGTVHIGDDEKSTFITSQITKHTETTAEIVALLEAIAWFKYINRVQKVNLPKKLTILMKRPDWVKWVNGESNGRGLLGKDKQEVLEIMNSFKFQEIKYSSNESAIQSFLNNHWSMLSPIVWVSWFNDRRIIYEFGLPISKTSKQISQASGVNMNRMQENNRDVSDSGIKGIDR
jgi:hypothetical protein